MSRGGSEFVAGGSSVVPEGSSWVLPWLVLAGLIVVPFAVQVDVERGRESVASLNLPAIDLLLLLYTAVGLVVFVTQAARGARPSLPAPPFEVLCFLGILGLSFVVHSVDSSAVAEVVQLLDYFLVWYVLVLSASRAQSFRSVLCAAVPILVLALTAVGAYQVFSGYPSYMVRGPFLDRQSYSACCILLFPLFWVSWQTHPSPWRKRVSDAVAGLTFCTLTSAIALLTLTLQLVFASSLIGGAWVRRSLAITVLALLVAAHPATSPFTTDRSRVDASPRVYLSQRRAEVLDAKANFVSPRPSLDFGLGPLHVFLGSRAMGWASNEAPRRERSPEEFTVVEEYFFECWSGLRLTARAPLLGYGPGSWRKAIGTSYESLERSGTSYPGTSNGYLMFATSLGLPGLSAWLLVLLRAVRRDRVALSTVGEPDRRALFAASIAGTVGSALFMCFSPWTLQALAAYWILLTVLPGASHGGEVAR